MNFTDSGINIYDRNSNLFASKTFYNIPLYLAPYATTNLVFTIDAPVKNINSNNGGGLYMQYNYYYTYTI